MGLPDRNFLENQQMWTSFRGWLWAVYDYIAGVGDIPGQVATAAGYAAAAAEDSALATSAASLAQDAKEDALAAASAAGPFRIYISKAEAITDIGSVPANGFIEVENDESLSGNPRTRYQKVSGVYVFVRDLSPEMRWTYTAQQAHKLGPFMDKLKTKPCRILTLGTSIASFQISGIQIVPELLANTYGRNASVIYQMGVEGGDYGPTDGHKKQVYGGAYYYRMVFAPGENDRSFTGFVDKIILVYGKESTGGAFDVYIDGVLETSLTSNGAQQYNVEYVKTFVTRGQHTITIKAPASGKAYLERVEMLQNDPGIIIENATLGGTGLRNTMVLHTDAYVGNETGIAISGYNGVDAIFGRTGQTKPDLILCQHFTNDGDRAVFADALGRAVAKTKAGAVPLVLCSEMPSPTFLKPAYLGGEGVLGTYAEIGGNSRFEQRQAIISYINEAHVAVVDWTQMVDFRDRDAYESKYYPTVDKTHPSDDGHAVMTAALCSLFNVPFPGRKNSEDVRRDRLRANQVLPQMGAADDPYGFRFVRPSGSKSQAQDAIHNPISATIAQAMTPSLRTLAVQISNDVPNLIAKADLDAILASSTSDAFGKYLRVTGSAQFASFTPFVASDIEQIYTVVLQVKASTVGSNGLRMFSPTDNLFPRIFVGDDRFSTTDTVNFPALSTLYDAPQFYAFHLRVNSGGVVGRAITLNGNNVDIYGMWITEGKQAIVTTRLKDVYRGLGTPMFMAGDAAIADVVIGQTYLESINSTTVEKVALEGFCYKPKTGTLHRIYEMRNKGSIKFARLLPVSPGSLTYNTKAGGLTAASGSGWAESAIFTSFPTSKTFTLLWRTPNNASLRVWFYNGGTDTYVFLKVDGTWQTQSGGNPNAFPGLGSSFPHHGALINNAHTFAMPDGSFSTALGASPSFNAQVTGGSSAWTPMTLCEGSSACVSATA